MAHIFIDDAETILSVRVFHDRFTDHRDLTTGLSRTDAQIQCIKRTLRYRTSGLGDVAVFSDQKSFRLVAVPAINDGRQVDVCDVAGMQFRLARNSMADDVVDTDAATFGKRHPIPRVAQTRRRVAVVLGELVDEAINFNRLDPGPNDGSNFIHQPSIKLPRVPHLLLLVAI